MDEFRIIGPNNHLYCGLIDIPRHKIAIKSIASKDSMVTIYGAFLTQDINLYSPAMEDIREMRELLDRVSKEKNIISFLEIRKRFSDKMVPHYIEHKKTGKLNTISYKRFYGEQKYYETVFHFTHSTKVSEIKTPYHGHRIYSTKKIMPFKLTAQTNDLTSRKFIKKIFVVKKPPLKIFKNIVKKPEDSHDINYLWERTEKEIKHLIEWGKTSGDYYGTIFPRDWMESADLAVHDLSSGAREYMYYASLKNVTQEGVSWHEDVVGEYKYQHELAGKDIFDRHMIDIEPRHIIGLKLLTRDYLKNEETRKKTKVVAQYILKKAREEKLITFKKIPDTKDYYRDGNWRDSEWAFKKVSSPIAPFDVNAVLYPEALRVLGLFQKHIGLIIPDIDALIKKWGEVKKLYKFKNSDQTTAYALALYDVKQDSKNLSYKQLRINHLDESYLYTYCACSKEEILSFCKRLLDKKYFYTDSGPTLIAHNNTLGYTSAEYHGIVIWTKQVAFVVLGLSKHLKIGIKLGWDHKTLEYIKNTILTTCETLISSFIKLDAIPELHFDVNGEPHFFTDQRYPGTQMSRVQLWSAVGARRILRKYAELKTSPQYKKI